MLSESARASSATEARYRIQTQYPTGRVVKVVDLDAATEDEISGFIQQIADTDLVVMRVTAGADAQRASDLGVACSDRRIMTTTIIVRTGTSTEAALSATLAQVRPWSLMVLVVNDETYVDDVLKSFR